MQEICERHAFDPWVGKISGEENGNSPQYSCLENPMDRGAWKATAHGVARVRHNLATKPPLRFQGRPKRHQ